VTPDDGADVLFVDAVCCFDGTLFDNVDLDDGSFAGLWKFEGDMKLKLEACMFGKDLRCWCVAIDLLLTKEGKKTNVEIYT